MSYPYLLIVYPDNILFVNYQKQQNLLKNSTEIQVALIKAISFLDTRILAIIPIIMSRALYMDTKSYSKIIFINKVRLMTLIAKILAGVTINTIQT